MSADLLLQEFERVAEAPDAVAHLRRFVLDVSVRGQLVDQDPCDEPACDLLRRIHAGKSEGSRHHGGNAAVDPYPGKPIDGPFKIPASWVWTSLGDVLTKLTDGTHHSPPNLAVGPFRYITAKNIKPAGVSLDDVTFVSAEVHREIFARCDPAVGDVLYIKDGATTGIVTINDLDEPFSMLSSVALLKLPPDLFNRLLVYFLRSPFFYQQMRGEMKGSALLRVTLSRMAPALVPLPPVAEQHRIVAKIDELMSLCDQLEAAGNDRETQRGALRDASLRRLSARACDCDPAADVRFFLQTSSRLISEPAHVAALRQTILDLAVHGRLVPQDPADEPACKLLLHGSSHGRPGDSALDSVSSRATGATLDAEFEPVGWCNISLRDVAPVITSGSRGWAQFYADHGALFVRSQNVKYGRLLLANRAYVALPGGSEGTRTRVEVGDLLTVITGDVGHVAVWDRDLGEAYVSQHIALVKPTRPELSPWLLLSLMAPAAGRQQLRASVYGGKPGLNLNQVRGLRLPLPPLAEQRRIVAQVDELMAICDALESTLASGRDNRGRLLEALLRDTLDGLG